MLSFRQIAKQYEGEDYQRAHLLYGDDMNVKWLTRVESENDCQGWTNTATWMYNLYIMQEKTIVDDLLRLRRKTQNGTINFGRAYNLLNQTGVRIDSYVENPYVNLAEILDNFAREHPL